MACRGLSGCLEVAEIDTAHFMGNFPESIELHALHNTNLPTQDIPIERWTEILPRTKVGPHRRHYFQLENVEGKVYTHVKVTIYPDGGLKRVRLVGKRVDTTHGVAVAGDNRTNGISETRVINGTDDGINVPMDTLSTDISSASPSRTVIPIVPLTPEAFAPFGKVIQAYADHNAAPRGTKITPANQGTASKFHKLAPLDSSYPLEAGATTDLSVYRCSSLPNRGENEEWEVKVLERHPFTTQAFIPMGATGPLGHSEDGLEDIGHAYLVVAAKNGVYDKPDLKTLRAFVASAAQGIMYNTAIWRKCFCGFSVTLALILGHRSTDGRL